MSRTRNINNQSKTAEYNYQGPGMFGISTLNARQIFVIGFAVLLVIVFFIKLIFLQVIDAEDVKNAGFKTRDTTKTILAHRGTIYDRNGNILAASVEVKSVYCDPKLVTDLQEEAECLVSVLGGEFTDYCELMTIENSRYVCIARKISLEDAQKLIDMSLDGFSYEDELERYYPYGQVGGQIVGCLDSNGVGLTGLEAYYDEVLAGENGTKSYEYGVNGTAIPGTVYESKEAVDGKDIVVSLDIDMQAQLEESLLDEYTRLEGDGASALLMDSSTGEILAMASYPLFNPADRSVVEEGSDQVKCITQAFEPGSVFKTVSALAILEEGTLTPEDEIECPTSLEADEYEVKDAHERSAVTYTFRDILKYSSNVGISLAVEDYLGFEKLYNKITQYGLAEATGVDYPNESAGYLADVSTWSKIQSYNVTFGQGVMATPLQIARFYSAIDNDGIAVTPHFLISYPQDGTTPSYETTTISTDQEALDTLKSMLVSVVEDGTGTSAAISGYTIAGKTSTAEIASDEGGYKEGVYNLAFCGFMPNSSSNLVCFVAVNDTPYLSNVCAAYKDIMTFAIDRYKISPE